MSIPEEELAELRESFNNFDLDGNGHITSQEIGNVMKSLGEDIPGYKLREIIKEVDSNQNGTVEFDEFLQIYKTVSSKAKGSAFKDLIKKREKINITGGSSEASAEGTKHSYSDSERAAFADWINYVLQDDADCKTYLPIVTSSDSDDMFEKMKDGILLCKMINVSVPQTVDERTINKGKLNAFKIHENQILVVNSANAIGCSVVNIGAEDLSKGKHHLTLGLLWQIIRIGLFSKISLAANPNIAALLREGESLNDLMSLSPEELLLRWVNYHLEKAGSNKRINNFSSDIKDSEAYAILLHRIAPEPNMIDRPESIMGVGNLTKRAEIFLGNADKIKMRKFLRAKDIVEGNPKLNLAFVANLFNNFPALDLEEVEEEFEPYEENREEKTFRNWMNSMGVNPFVNHLYNDLGDGIILFQLYDIIQPGIVNWDKVNKRPFKLATGGNMKKIENCNYAVELGKKLGFSLVGIGGEDIRNGTKTLVLALIWQLMRAYTLAMLSKLSKGESINDAMIVEWINKKLESAGKSTRISGCKDSAISSSKPVIDLVDAIKPGSIDYSLVLDGANDEEKLLNATYAISMSRKIGARVYALAEDLVEVKPKMVLTIFACLMTLGLATEV
ncbi:plastin-2-like [Rhopilema esculentum]|uniref:plastin-2-like n=1 Tax=Rhopilema esculentum TaxID=499914 RepID=UPI0031DD51ED